MEWWVVIGIAALAIPLEEFDVITAFGTDRLRASILVERHTSK